MVQVEDHEPEGAPLGRGLLYLALPLAVAVLGVAIPVHRYEIAPRVAAAIEEPEVLVPYEDELLPVLEDLPAGDARFGALRDAHLRFQRLSRDDGGLTASERALLEKLLHEGR